MLRYGDGTPFPFVENVLAILEDAVAGCAEMFAAATELDRQRETAAAVRRVVEEEGARLVALEQAFVKAAELPAPRDPAIAVSQQAARRAVAASQRLLRDARKELDDIAARQAAEPAWEPLARRVHLAAVRFFERQSLPGTLWNWSWDVLGAASRAEATGHAAPFEVAFELEVAPVWRAPVRIGVLGAGLVLQLPMRKMFGAPQVAATKLDGLFLVQAAVDGKGRSMLLRERATPSAGWRIHVPAQGAARCHLVDRDGRSDGPEFELARDEHLDRLWTAIDAEIAAMHAKRHARDVRLGGQPLTAIAEITTAPRTILDILAPIVRAIRAHSRMPGELVLKRDVADGVRAELYVSRQAIVAHYAELPPEYRRYFDDGGFGRDFTEPPPPASDPRTSAPRFARASQAQIPPPQMSPQVPPRIPPHAPAPSPLAVASPPRRSSFARPESCS